MSSVCSSNQENAGEENSRAVFIDDEEEFEDCTEDDEHFVADDHVTEVTSQEELRQLRHWVWRYFIPLGKKEKRYALARCIACSRSFREDPVLKSKLKTKQEFDVPARTERNMKDHLRDCPKLTIDERRAIVGNTVRDVGKKRKLEVDTHERQKGPSLRQSGVESYFRKYSEKLPTSVTESIDTCLARLVIEGNVSFRTIEKECFQQFAKAMCPGYPVPSRYALCTTITGRENGKIEESLYNLIDENCNGFTLLLDGWSDKLRRALYGFVFAQRGEAPIVLDLQNHSSESCSAEYLKKTTKALLERYVDDNLMKVSALVTDSPSVMRKLRREMKADYPHLIVLPCILHALNLVVKSIMLDDLAKRALANACTLTATFRNSHALNHSIRTYCKKHNLPMLQPYCQTRWSSLVNTCAAVSNLGEAFKRAAKGPEGRHMSREIQRLCKNGEALEEIDLLCKAVRPISDAICRLQSRDASLADCQIELLRIGYDLQEICDEDTGFDSEDSIQFRKNLVDAFNVRYREYADPLYVVALSLHPYCSTLAVSGKWTTREIGLELNRISRSCKLVKGEKSSIRLLKEYKKFVERTGSYKSREHEKDPFRWWKSTDPENNALKQVALRIFSICPGSADVERLFSNLAAANTKVRSGLSVTTMAKVAKMKTYYQAETNRMKSSSSKSCSCIRIRKSAELDLGQVIEGLSLPSEDDDLDTVGEVEAATLADFEGFEDEANAGKKVAEVDVDYSGFFDGAEAPSYSLADLRAELERLGFPLENRVEILQDFKVGEDPVHRSVVVGLPCEHGTMAADAPSEGEKEQEEEDDDYDESKLMDDLGFE